MTPKLSQVFLRDPSWIDRCVSRVEPAPFGVEWACGDGALTGELINRWESGIGIELDQSFCRQLVERFGQSDWEFIRGDLLDYPLPDRDETYPMVGNLPYHVTGPALMKILRHADRLSTFQGLVQWEVGERLTAPPGDSNFRGISLLYQWAGSVEVPFKVPSEAFEPRPDVDSAWVEFQPDLPGGSLSERASFARTIFHMPRKTLVNNLTDDTGEKTFWRNWMADRDWDDRRRPQSLTPDEFEVLYETWVKRNRSS